MQVNALYLLYSCFYLAHLQVIPLNALGKSMSTKGTKHLPTFYLHFTYKYQKCVHVVERFMSFNWNPQSCSFNQVVLFASKRYLVIGAPTISLKTGLIEGAKDMDESESHYSHTYSSTLHEPILPHVQFHREYALACLVTCTVPPNMLILLMW